MNTYKVSEVISFRKTKEVFGGLSNMAAGFPLIINDSRILTSEALYQACRFPHLPEIQKKIIEQKSPMAAKMVGKPYRIYSRSDWDEVRVDIMRRCLKIKLYQNFADFGRVLTSTGNKEIVEESTRDRFWGAVKSKENPSLLVGINQLGQLLTELREEFVYTGNKPELLIAEPIHILDFKLLGHTIEIVSAH